MSYFFCDIRGTFDGDYKRNEYLDSFFEQLSLISKECDDKFVFCFITSDNNDYLDHYINEVTPYLRKYNIINDEHFSYDCEYKNHSFVKIDKNSKIDQMKYLLKDKDVNSIYYADDSYANQRFFNGLMKRLYPNAKTISFIPGSDIDNDTIYGSSDKGISGLTSSIKSYLSYNKKLSRKR